MPCRRRWFRLVPALIVGLAVAGVNSSAAAAQQAVPCAIEGVVTDLIGLPVPG